MFPAPSACAPARPRASALPPPPLLPLACPPAGEDKACFTPSMYVTFLNPSMCVTFLNPSMYVTFLNPSMCVEKLREVGSHLARAGPGLIEGGAARTLVVDRAEVPERHVSDPPLVCAQRKAVHAKDARQKMHALLQNTRSTQNTADACNTIVRTRHAVQDPEGWGGGGARGGARGGGPLMASRSLR